ncbi:MAG: potassium channel family protein [Alphaproteobacteria bacterium]|nr:potassium channel family protein [Alphaproteobacteria bacterium]MDX5370626.1 potassium channel family protein [Alphaproteobacteria bacterium]MDX5465071.1 potassium channel family protein [Alphaproteobacteria bacterium]
MLTQIAAGTIVIVVSLFIHGMGIALAVDGLNRFFSRISHRQPPLRRLQIVFGGIMLILLLNTICVYIWAAAFEALGVVGDWETAVYFSLVCYTTLGFGDILGAPEWRLLSGFAATNGMIAFGISTAFLIELMRRVHFVER